MCRELSGYQEPQEAVVAILSEMLKFVFLGTTMELSDQIGTSDAYQSHKDNRWRL